MFTYLELEYNISNIIRMGVNSICYLPLIRSQSAAITSCFSIPCRVGSEATTLLETTCIKQPFVGNIRKLLIYLTQKLASSMILLVWWRLCFWLSLSFFLCCNALLLRLREIYQPWLRLLDFIMIKLFMISPNLSWILLPLQKAMLC